MPYPGVAKELVPKLDRCVKKVMKDGKSKSSAIAICRTSIGAQKQKSKEEKAPDRIVEGKGTETRMVYFSQTPMEGKTMDATQEGKLLKGVEIFKSGTYRNTQFKNSAIDKMVAHFHYLKSMGIFSHVPVRADHPGFSFFGGGGDIIDKVGGYIEDLRRVGNKMVANFRITSEQMWKKVAEGSYINRSAEIGTYDDNEGTVYSPVLFGVAWVDIPQVEGLSPKFSYSKDDKNIELINLNSLSYMENEETKDTFPPEETPAEEPKEETPAETPKEEVPAEEPEKLNKSKIEKPMEFEKAFPQEAEELKKLREEKLAYEMEKRTAFVEELERKGKIIPAQKETEIAFVKDLTAEQYEKYKEAKEIAPQIVKLDNEEVKTEEPEKEEEKVEPTPEEKADAFLRETK